MKGRTGKKKGVAGGTLGQSTLEFALAIALLMSIVLFFMQLSFLFAYGNLVHYATFMAARAYLSSGPSDDDQVERAKSTIIKLLKRGGVDTAVERYKFVAQGEGGSSEVKGLAVGPGSVYQPYDSKFSWQDGIRYSFRASLPMIPLSGANRGANRLTLTSESWLGREKSEEKCQEFMKSHGGGLLDNGC